MKYLKDWKVFENAYSSIDEYQEEILGFLKKYNLFPEQTRYLLNQYSDAKSVFLRSHKFSVFFNYIEMIAVNII